MIKELGGGGGVETQRNKLLENYHYHCQRFVRRAGPVHRCNKILQTYLLTSKIFTHKHAYTYTIQLQLTLTQLCIQKKHMSSFVYSLKPAIFQAPSLLLLLLLDISATERKSLLLLSVSQI